MHHWLRGDGHPWSLLPFSTQQLLCDGWYRFNLQSRDSEHLSSASCQGESVGWFHECVGPPLVTLSFIHSFIPAISIAPFQVLYYSEALPTTARILYRSFTPKRTG